MRLRARAKRCVRGEARQWRDRALPLSSGQPPVVRAKALNASGVLAGMQADDERAEACFAESLVLWRAIGDTTIS